MIVKFTNQKAEKHIEDWNKKYPKQKTWIPTDSLEMYAVLGLLITAGALKANREPVHFLWCKNPLYSRPIFPAAMSRDRFLELIWFMRFDDLSTRVERRGIDKLAAFREVFEIFVGHCKESYYPSSHLTIDEQLVGFRGKCPFRVYMKSKPAKYGIKIWALVDANAVFATNLQIYTGKEGNKAEKTRQARSA